MGTRRQTIDFAKMEEKTGITMEETLVALEARNPELNERIRQLFAGATLSSLLQMYWDFLPGDERIRPLIRHIAMSHYVTP